MSSTQTMNELATGMAPTGTVDLKVEVVVIPVADVDRSKRFLATMKELLREAEARHGEYEPTAPKHQWPEWYAEYIVARQRGKTPDEAANYAVLQTERISNQVRT